MSDAKKIDRLAKWLGLPNDRVIYDEDIGDDDDDYEVWWVKEGGRMRPWQPDKLIEDAWMLLEKECQAFRAPQHGSKPYKEARHIRVKLGLLGQKTFNMTAPEAARAIFDAVLDVIP